MLFASPTSMRRSRFLLLSSCLLLAVGLAAAPTTKPATPVTKPANVVAPVPVPPPVPQAASPLTVGAIRWDAWSGGPVTSEVERTLSPAKYRERLPWFAQVDASGRARIQETPAVMTQEIEYAAAAGLSYWAFLLYQENDPMSQGLAMYLRSANRAKLGFCVVLHNVMGAPEAKWPTERDRILRLLKEPGYQKVLGNRPLVYAFGLETQTEVIARRFNDLRRAALKAGLNPYYVFMGWNPSGDYQTQSNRGFHAASNYAYGSEHATYGELVAAVEKDYWANAHLASIPYIPLVTTGWDKRPRQDNPVSWEQGASYLNQKTFPATATPAEIAGHLERALAFVKANPKVCQANTVILYAWNEHDEGGWLCPTYRDADSPPNADRLVAIRKVILAATK